MSTNTHDRLEALERRVRELEDRDAIVRTLYVLGQTLDYGDHARWLACFTDDCVFEMVEVGETGSELKTRKEGKGALTAFIPHHTHAPAYFHKHLVSDPMITITGDNATCASYLTRIDKGAEGPFLWSFGRYRDEFRRCSDGIWRASARTIEVESRAVPVKGTDIGR